MSQNPKLRLGTNHLGKAIFATVDINKGEFVQEFTGKILREKFIPHSYSGSRDRYMQVGPDEYMGPSGDFDDLINHSCDPNCGMRFDSRGTYLVAIRDIKEGEEVTWDYSTTLLSTDWVMKCRCRQPSCRKVIGDFFSLDPSLQKKYLDLDVILPYIRDMIQNGTTSKL